jgi:hypothetical protein
MGRSQFTFRDKSERNVVYKQKGEKILSGPAVIKNRSCSNKTHIVIPSLLITSVTRRCYCYKYDDGKV